MSCCPGLNRGPLPYHGSALPAELQQHKNEVGFYHHPLNDLLLPSKHSSTMIVHVDNFPFTSHYSKIIYKK